VRSGQGANLRKLGLVAVVALAGFVMATVAIAATLFLLEPSAAGTSRVSPTSCGNISSALVFAITARRISCVVARRVVREWLFQCERAQKDPCRTTSQFHCRTRDASYRYNHIGCVYELDRRKAFASQRNVIFRIEGG
jgi:hypothetical protein